MTLERVALRLLAAVSLALLASGATAAASGAQTGGKAPPKVVFAGGLIYHSETIPAGATVSFKVTCPPPMTASSGGLSSGDPRVLSLLSVPAGAKAWSFGFRNTDTKNAITVVVVVVCVKPTGISPAAFTAAIKKFKKKKPVVGVVPPGSSQTLTAPCPKGEAPVGDSVQSGEAATPKSVRVASVSDVGGAQVTSVALGRRAVSVGLRNSGPAAVTAEVGANCLPRSVSSHGRQVAVQLARVSTGVTVAGHGSIVSGGCPGQMPLAAGFSLPPSGPLGFLGTGFGTGPVSASWAFSNSSGQPQQAQVSLVCTPGTIKFSQGAPVSQGIDTIVGPITITGG
jgi:hypothetical protein